MPAAFAAKAGGDDGGVERDRDGHIIAVRWDQLSEGNAWLRAWKDRPIGPGHPLATHIDPRAFIPSSASGGEGGGLRTPEATLLRPPPTTATPTATVDGEDSSAQQPGSPPL